MAYYSNMDPIRRGLESFMMVNQVADTMEERARRKALADVGDVAEVKAGQMLPGATETTDADGSTSYVGADGKPGAPIAEQDGFAFKGRTYGTEGQATAAQIAAQAGVLGKSDPRAAAKLRAEGIELQDAEQKRSDAVALRRALADEGRASVGSGTDFTGNTLGYSDGQGKPAGSPAPDAAPGAAPKRGDDPLRDYLTRVAPRVTKELIQQGKLSEAKSFTEFVDSSDGQAYAKRWLSGVRKHQVGDHVGALGEFERMYNEQLYSDGNSVRLTPLEGGARYRIEQIGPDGQILGAMDGATADLAGNAAAALSPMSAVKFHAEQAAQRAKEAALLDRSIKLEGLRQTGQEAREDARDARLERRLEAQDKALDKRLSAQARNGARGGLTLAQERANIEIDAAREQVAGLSPDEIRRRTAKTTDTGRENPDYDPTLARAASLASRRKLGGDEWFDGRDRQPVAPAFDRKDVATRFRADRSMDKYTLGRETPNGIEVLEKGRVVGHYR